MTNDKLAVQGKGEDLQLIEPTLALIPDFIAYCHDFEDLNDIPGIGGMDVKAPEVSVPHCIAWARGINIPEGRVSADTLWAVRGERIVGVINLRHELTAYLAQEGGHIGYSVRPSERRKGYATWMLERVLERAHERGLARLLITCDKRNAASRAVIEKCGGVLKDEVKSITPGREWTRRYWIEL